MSGATVAPSYINIVRWGESVFQASDYIVVAGWHLDAMTGPERYPIRSVQCLPLRQDSSADFFGLQQRASVMRHVDHGCPVTSLWGDCECNCTAKRARYVSRLFELGSGHCSLLVKRQGCSYCRHHSGQSNLVDMVSYSECRSVEGDSSDAGTDDKDHIEVRERYNRGDSATDVGSVE